MFIKQIVWNLFFAHDLDFVRNNYIPVKQLERIKELEHELELSIAEYNELSAEHEDLRNELEKQIEELTERIKILKNEPILVERPEWLRPDATILPKVRIAGKTGDTTVEMPPTHIYTYSNEIENLVSKNEWRELYMTDKKQCAMDIWKYVVDIEYELDKVEDWRYSTLTVNYGKGDCEDTTILFLDLAKASGFKANEIFAVFGWLTKNNKTFGHAFPILNIGDGWHIYESTLSRLPSAPMKFKGSNYDGSFGVSNWQFSGSITNRDKQI